MKNSEKLIKKIKELEQQAKTIENLAYELIIKAPLKYYPMLGQYGWDILPQEIVELQNAVVTSYRGWYYSVLELIKQFLSDEILRFEECYENKSGKGYEFGVLDILHFKVEVYESDKRAMRRNFQEKLHIQIGMLSSITALDVDEFEKRDSLEKITSLKKLEKILLKFHEVSIKLNNRVSRPSRSGFPINDEYDVQDLLHSLLTIEFEDIRSEEYVPSYASNNSRVDFLLKNEKILIETKKSRENLKDKKIVEELMIDIQYYQKHPDCRILYCFIYDPDDLIQNRAAITNELSKDDEEFKVKIIFSPKRS